MALHRDLYIEQGTTWGHGFVPKLNGDPFLDETWTVQGQIRRDVGAADVLYEWSTDLGNVSVADGAAVLALIPTETSAWDWRGGVYDLEASRDEITYRLVYGRIVVLPEVTR